MCQEFDSFLLYLRMVEQMAASKMPTVPQLGNDLGLQAVFQPSEIQEVELISSEISTLLNKLYNIYTKEYFYEFPLNLPQYSHMFNLYSKVLSDFFENPVKNLKIQEKFLNDWNSLCFSALNDFWGYKSKTVEIDEPQDDKRFTAPEWKDCIYFKNLKKSYYLITKYSLKWLSSIGTLDKISRQQLHFYLKNYLNMIAPSNYLLSNPQVLKTTLESNGVNFLKGLKNYLEDLVLNQGRPNVRMTDIKSFKVGKNLGITPGKVIFQNDLMQLIQYSPTTDTVYETPILFVPPWINKYYILDLSPENSLVKWLVDQGFTVYMISWINPGPTLASKGFSDYMSEGPIQAIDVIINTSKAPSVHTVGYCIGGTLLSCALSVLQHQGDTKVASSTFLMTLLNFSNPGELGVFLDETQLQAISRITEKKGYYNGRLLDMAFNVLRPNDLIWPYFINNYLLGKPSKPFDILYWNADSSNLPHKMFNFYLRNMYLKNKLAQAGKLKLNGIPIDLTTIKVPCFFLASETDHITLWHAVYSGARLLKAPIDFVLTSSGHVAGAINPPIKNKYSYRFSKKYTSAKKLPTRSSDWLNSTKEFKGSWWPHWAQWLININPEQVPARDPMQAGIPIIEDAPGSYVLKRL